MKKAQREPEPQGSSKRLGQKVQKGAKIRQKNKINYTLRG